MISVGNYALPVLLLFIFIVGSVKLKDNLFSTFTIGAKKGLKTVYSIAPTLVGLVSAIEMFKASGALDALSNALLPLASAVGLPKEIMPLIILRPISGSGAIALLNDILQGCGVNSLCGRTAAVICASGETTFYTSALYFGSVGVKKTRHTFVAAIFADLIGIFASSLAVRLFFY